MKKPRCAGRPQKYSYRYGYPKSREREIRSQLLKACSVLPATEKFVDRINSCGTHAYRNIHTKSHTRRCAHDFCSDCHRHRQITETNLVMRDFASVPKDEIFSVTVLFEPRARISSECIDPNKTGYRDVTDVLKCICFQKDTYRKALKAARPDQVIQWGWIEFAEHDLTEKPYVARLVDQMCAADGLVAQDVTSETGTTLIMHVHLLLHIRKDGRSMTKDEINGFLHETYPHSRQVVIKSLWESQSKYEAMDRFIGYCHKHPTRLSDLATAELGMLILHKPLALRFTIRWNTMRVGTVKDRHIAPATNDGPAQCVTHPIGGDITTPDVVTVKRSNKNLLRVRKLARQIKREALWKDTLPNGDAQSAELPTGRNVPTPDTSILKILLERLKRDRGDTLPIGTESPLQSSTTLDESTSL